MVALFATAAARGEGPPAARRIGGKLLLLEWQAPSTCPTRETVLDRTERLVGSTHVASATTELRVRASVEQSLTGVWQLLFDSSQGSAQARQMQGKSCAEMADAAALLLALLIDPTLPEPPARGSVEENVRADEAAPGESETEPRSAAESSERMPSPEREVRPSPTSTRAASRRTPSVRGLKAPTFEATAEFVVWLNRLPELAPGVQLGAGARFTRLRLLGSLGYFPSRAVPFSNGDARIGFGSAGLEVAYRLFKGAVAVDPLLSVDVEWVNGSRAGRSGRVWLLGLGAGFRSNYFIYDNLAVQVHALVSAPVARPGFVVGDDEARRPDPVGFRLGAGALWVTDPKR